MRRRYRAVAALVGLLAGLFVMLGDQQVASASQVGDAAANVGLGELGANRSAGHLENPANSGCNKYSGELYGTSSGCAAGYGDNGHWGTNAWCADFAKWVWKQVGIDTGGLDSRAITFYSYGVSHGTWHPAGSGYTPQPGDAILYGINSSHTYADHVGVVASSSGPGVVQGNFATGGNWGVVWDPNGTYYNASGTRLPPAGYVSPAGGSAPPPGNIGHVIASPCLYLRLGMSGGTPSIGCIPDGTTITVDCVLKGQSVTGPYGTENTWDHTSYNGQIGYVSDSWIYTGSNNPIAGGCGGNGVAMEPGCLQMRAGPYNASAAVGCVNQASPITIGCTAGGDSSSGPYGATNLWDQVSVNGATGFVTDAWVYTGTANPVAGTCGYVPPRPPQLGPAITGKAVRGKPYASTFTASGASPLSYSVIASSLPGGLTLAPGGRLSGTPTRAGTYTFTVTVADGESPPATAQGSYTIKVAPIAVRTATLPAARHGRHYSRALTAWGGSKPLAWRRTAGALPRGLKLTRSGVIAGTPARSGRFHFQVRVRDAAGHTAARRLALRVR